MEFLTRLRNIDRRVISTLVILVLVLPMVLPVHLPTVAFPATRELRAFIDTLPPGKLVIVACDWDASTKGECQPLTACVMDYLFRRHQPFAIFGLAPQGPELAQKSAEALALKLKCTYGTDWVNFGFRPNGAQTLIAMMNDLPGVVKKDIKDQPITTYAMMKGVKKLPDVGLIYEVTGTGILDAYLQFCGGVSLAQGCTAVIGPEQYTYLQSGQLKGLLVGLGGAAQFETFTDFTEPDGYKGGQGMRGMGSQSLGHLLVMALIVMGNLGVWAAKRRPPAEPPAPETPVGDAA
ncbi:MAG: hypothetical protein HYU66_18845 [Armatimonadetes bacterium]|nr:hypothetical protein [Armatimonadota bacterium]